MIYMRGQAADYDHWRQLGLAGWGWDDVLPFFKRHEDNFLGASAHHAVGGEWRVEPPRVRWPLLEAFRTAAAQAGIKPIADFNTGDNEGSCYFHVNQKRGRRWSAARGFLKPVLSRPNLRLETGCLVTGLVFDGLRANGVRWRQDGRQRRARCRGEVILAAGAIGSPHFMLLSGVGPAAQLREHGIPIVLDRPGVGDNLQDHLQLRAIYKVTGARTLNDHLSFAVRPRRHGARICAAAARAADHGAVAARPVHPLRSFARARQHPVPRAAVVARPLRRAAASLPRVHRERHQRAADEPRASAAALRRPGGAAGDRAELSVDRRGPPRRRRFHPHGAAHRRAAGARAVSSRRVLARAGRRR